MNKKLNLPALQGIMREFEKQQAKSSLTEEAMGDALDDAFEVEGEQEETDDVVNQVLDELGCNLSTQLVDAPTAAAPAPVAAQRPAEAMPAGGEGLDNDLAERLAKLRKG